MYPASPAPTFRPPIRPGPEDPSIALAATSTAAWDPGPTARGTPSDEADAALLAAAGRGDLAAFNELVARHQDFLYALAVRTTRDPVLAEDALQEGLLHAFGRAPSYRGEGCVRGWIARIVLNACRDAQRWHGRRRADPLPDQPAESTSDPRNDPHRALVLREQARLLEDALGRLSPEQRVALLLHVAHGFEYVEIAEATGVAVGTVKSRIHRGRLALRDLLVDHRDLFADAS
jgi:RNA polymerase sigma-70 factor (ECF subfamily)